MSHKKNKILIIGCITKQDQLLMARRARRAVQPIVVASKGGFHGGSDHQNNKRDRKLAKQLGKQLGSQLRHSLNSNRNWDFDDQVPF